MTTPTAAPSLTESRIDEIWRSMPGGPAGWIKSFGYLDFARAIEDEVLLAGRAAPSVPVAVPHDFTTHRDAWRDAITEAMNNAAPSTVDSDQRAYWERELVAYDRAFDALLSLAVPLPADQGEAVAFMWQHEETGRIGFVEAEQLANGWREGNPRLHIVAPLYAAPAALPAGPSEQPAALGEWISVDFMLPEPDVEVLIDGQEGVEVARYLEAEDDQVDQMGHDAGFWGFKFAACGRSFGNPDYMRPAQGQPKFWMHLPEAPSECDECAGTGKCGPDDNPSEMDCEVCNGSGTTPAAPADQPAGSGVAK